MLNAYSFLLFWTLLTLEELRCQVIMGVTAIYHFMWELRISPDKLQKDEIFHSTSFDGHKTC